VLDIAKFDSALDRNVLLKRETLERAWTPAVSTRGQTLPYGLGWFVQRQNGIRLVWHYGYWPQSFSSLYLKVPERDLTFVLLANSDALSAPFNGLGLGDVMTSPFATAFLRAFVNENLGDDRAANRAIDDWLRQRRSVVRRERSLSVDALDRFVGRYELEPGRAMTIARSGAKLVARFPNDSDLELFAEDDARFFCKVRDLQVAFSLDGRRVLGLEATYWGSRFRARKVD